MNINLKSGSFKETEKIGWIIGKNLGDSALILLSGKLGSGKTTIAKGIGSSLGVNPKDIVSPTYTLMNIYHGTVNIFHIDLYRMGESPGIEIPEIDDNLGDGIIVVEWAAYADKSYRREKNLVEIYLELRKGEPDMRNIIIKSDYLNIPQSAFRS